MGPKGSKRSVAVCWKHLRQLNEPVVPFAGVIHPQNGRAEARGNILPDGQSQSDPGADTAGAVDENGASMAGGGGADHDQAQPQTVAAVLNGGLPQIAAENLAPDGIRDFIPGVLNGELEHSPPAG